jgi:hypothetical protein
MTDAVEAPTTEPTDTDQPETDWKAEARKWEERAKTNAKKASENSSAAQRLAEIEEANKSELQRWQERAEQAEARATQFETQQQVSAWKAEIATAAGLPADVLRGSTREEIEAHAEILKPLLAAMNRGPFVPSPGAIPDTPITDDAAFARSLFTGQ